METALEFLKLGIVGLIAGFFSSYLSNRDHRRRVWWDKRVAAYQGAIEAISDLVYYYDVQYLAETEQRKLDKEFEKKLHEFWGPAFHRIRKAADSGAFIFSEQANKALADFIESGDEYNDMPIEYLEKRLSAARLCLGKLVELSMTDLHIQTTILERYL